MARRPSWMHALLLSLVLAVAASACSSASSQSAPAPAVSSSHAGSSPASSTPPPSTAPATPARSTQSGTPTAMTSVVPVVVCRTTFGITPPPAPKTQPTSLTLTVPGGTGAELAIYTDDQGRMRLLAPRSWSCSAMYGADGSGGITVYPTGESVPSDWGAGWKISATSPVQAVIGSQTSACFGCTVGQ